MTPPNLTEEQRAEHTPGPWSMGQAPYTYETALVSASGAVVADAAWDGGSGCHLSIKNPADARLIAAAPDLLEALKGAIGALEYDYDAGKDQGDSDWKGMAYMRLEAARTAIARATGEAQS